MPGVISAKQMFMYKEAKPLYIRSLHFTCEKNIWGTWVAQWVKHLASAQVTVCGFKPHVGLCADSPDPGAYFGFCVSLSLCPSPALTVTVSFKNK